MAVKRYDGSAWQTVAGLGAQGAAATSSSIATWVKTASGGETSLSGNDDNSQALSYTVGQELVFINGTLLKRGSDYTATNGTSITGLTALAANDVATVWTVNAFSVTNAISSGLVTTTGDMIYASGANTPARLAIGSTDQVLKVSGGIPAWGATPNPAYVGVSAYRNGTSTALTANTSYAIPLTAENWDTDGFHDNTTNNTRFTIPSGKAGKYLLFMTVRFEGTANYAFFYINKNGTTPLTGIQSGVHQQRNLAGNNWMFHGAFVCDAAVGDYFTFEVLNSDTQTAAMYAVCSATFLGA